jgi:excinuclease UvrABC helicase subunit UvrB
MSLRNFSRPVERWQIQAGIRTLMECRSLVAVLDEDVVAVLAEEEDAVQVLGRAWKEHVLAEGQAEVMVAPEA